MLPAIDGSALTNLPPSGGAVEAVASGALANGDTIILKADGTVSSVGVSLSYDSSTASTITASSNAPKKLLEVKPLYPLSSNTFIFIQSALGGGGITVTAGVVSGTTITFGNTVTSLAGGQDKAQLDTFRGVSNTFIVGWHHQSYQNYYLWAGTVSGTTITMGSEYIALSSSNFSAYPNIACCESTSSGYKSKVAIYYRSGTDGYVKTVDVSGTTITAAGSAVAHQKFGSTSTDLASGQRAITFTKNELFVVMYRGSNYQHELTSGSMGSTGGINWSSNTGYIKRLNIQVWEYSLYSDPINQNNFMIVFPYANNLQIVPATRSAANTYITTYASYTASNFSTSYTGYGAGSGMAGVEFDPAVSGKWLAYYPSSSSGNSGDLRVIEGNGGWVSGTPATTSLTSSFASGTWQGGGYVDFTAQCFSLHPNLPSGNVLWSVVGGFTSSTGGTAHKPQCMLASTSSNLSTSNYLGISDAAYAGGASATIQSASSVATNQSGLTIGADYYVQQDGTLATTPDPDYEVYTGVATSATDLAIRLSRPNAFTDTKNTKLSGIAAGATAGGESVIGTNSGSTYADGQLFVSGTGRAYWKLNDGAEGWYEVGDLLMTANSYKNSISCGTLNTVIIKADGTVWTTGNNQKGQLGNGGTQNRNYFVSSGISAIAVAAGYAHIVVIKADNTVWSVGDNTYGQLGDGSTTNRSTYVSSGISATAVACGNHVTLAIKSDNTVWGVGYNNLGQVGDGTTTNRSTFVNTGMSAIAVSGGTYHTAIIKTDNTVWAVGSNSKGQLGNNSFSNRSAFVSSGISGTYVQIGVRDTDPANFA